MMIRSPEFPILSRAHFLNLCRVEKRRSDRSKAPLSLALFYLNKEREADLDGVRMPHFLAFLRENTRESDMIGWVDNNVIGVLLPGTNEAGAQECVEKITNGNGRYPFSVITGTYPDHSFDKILAERSHLTDPFSLNTSESSNAAVVRETSYDNDLFYSKSDLRKKIREEKIRSCRTGGAFSLVLFRPSRFIHEEDNGNRKLIETILGLGAQEPNETMILGEWDRKTAAILLLDMPPESAFSWAEKLLSGLRSRGYRPTGSAERGIFQFFTFKGDKRIIGCKEQDLKDVVYAQRGWMCGDLSTFHCLERHHEWMKRAIDLMASTLLLFLFSPLFVILGMLIKMDSPGPVFYRQTRIGRGGKPFTFLKFRTMRQNADERVHQEHVRQLMNGEAGLSDTGRAGERSYKLTEDDRVSKLGKFLRKMSIDELPQLINVLKGEMTLVGPRPHPVYEAELYDLWKSFRLNVKPGITGLGQVYGRFNMDYEDVYRLDLRYFKNASFILDLKILFKTFSIVFSGRGAN